MLRYLKYEGSYGQKTDKKRAKILIRVESWQVQSEKREGKIRSVAPFLLLGCNKYLILHMCKMLRPPKAAEAQQGPPGGGHLASTLIFAAHFQCQHF